MVGRIALAILWLIIGAPAASAQIPLGDTSKVVFASVEQSREVLASTDDFAERMSPFDRSARLKTDKPVTEREYLEFVGQCVQSWKEDEKNRVTDAIRSLLPKLGQYNLPLPPSILLVKTNGMEEGGAPYTRGNAIIFPEKVLSVPPARMHKLICHELFHIMSRANAELKEKLYQSIGFFKCMELAFPPTLRSRKLTNPDAPKNDHVIRVTVNGEETWAIPILFSSADKYDTKRGGEFFSYLNFQFLLVDRLKKSDAYVLSYDEKDPRLVPVQQLQGFFEQVGNNTGYIIHPEEILADNFALMVLGEADVPSPKVLQKMKDILEK